MGDRGEDRDKRLDYGSATVRARGQLTMFEKVEEGPKDRRDGPESPRVTRLHQR